MRVNAQEFSKRSWSVGSGNETNYRSKHFICVFEEEEKSVRWIFWSRVIYLMSSTARQIGNRPTNVGGPRSVDFKEIIETARMLFIRMSKKGRAELGISEILPEIRSAVPGTRPVVRIIGDVTIEKRIVQTLTRFTVRNRYRHRRRMGLVFAAITTICAWLAKGGRELPRLRYRPCKAVFNVGFHDRRIGCQAPGGSGQGDIGL